MSLDLKFVKCVLLDPSALELLPKDFASTAMRDEGRAAYDFVVDHFRRHGEMPSQRTVLDRTGVDLREIRPEEPASYYAERIVESWQVRKLGDGLRQSVKLLEEGNVSEIVRVLDAAAAQVKSVDSTGRSSLVDLTDPDCIKRRRRRYRDSKLTGHGPDGVPTPWDTINECTRGIHEDELWVILARLETGKTWLLLKMALHAWQTGADKRRKILFVSQEMGVDQIARRWDAMAAGVPYEDFRAGRLDTENEKRWREVMESHKTMPGFYLVGKQRVQTVEDLDVVMSELKPAVTFVDGAYFLNGSDARGSKWDRSSRIMDGLQDLAKRKQRPLVVTWQFNREVTQEKDGDADSVAYSYETMMHADVALALKRDEHMVANGLAKLRVLKSRESRKPPPITLNFDFSAMNFSEVGPDGGEWGGGA